MQVFNAFFKVLRSKLGIVLIYMIVFVALVVVMTFTDTASGMFEQERLSICVFDEDCTPESAALREFIGKRNDLRELENDNDTIIDALYYGRVDYVLTIGKGYSAKLAAGDTDGLFESKRMHDSYSTVYMGQTLNEYASTVSAYIAAGNDISAAVSKAGDAMLKDAEVTTISFDNSSGGALSLRSSFFFRFLVYVLISLTMSTLCPVLLAMNRKDVRYRTDCSGIRPNSYTLQLFAGSIIYIFLTWIVLMAVGVFMNGGMFEGMQLIAVLNSFIFMVFSALLTILLSSFSPSINVINIITQVISIGMCFTCGVFVEQSFLGESVLAAARFMPAYWYMRVNRMLDGSETYDGSLITQALLIETAFVIAVGAVTILIRRIKLSDTSALIAGRVRA
ncbi:MAG: ABC transporter permease [Ruminiclostridium sp.]|nr:ABC transporter permease [Ruminiclostridium sp.]